MMAYFVGSIWCSVGPVYVSSDLSLRINKKIVDVNDDTALDKILNIQPKPYEYKDVINRGTKRVYGFMSQQIAEIIPEAVSTQKGTLYDIHSNFKCNGNIVHINIDDYEETYNVGDVLCCITDNILYKNYIYTYTQTHTHTHTHTDEPSAASKLSIHISRVDRLVSRNLPCGWRILP